MKSKAEQKAEPGADWDFSTKAVHTGCGYTGQTGAVMPPIYMTSTFVDGNADGFDYTRSGNPNFRLLQESLAALEGAKEATCFASGVSAITAVVSSLKSGDCVLAEESLYGCTYRLLEQVFSKFGVQARYVDFSRVENWEEIRRCRPALVWLESPTNPLLKVVDIVGISRVAEEVGTATLVDNTFASPYLQQPLALGATLSLSSSTKYLNGHSDCLGGAVATNDRVWHARMQFAQKALGLQPSPFDAWLTLRGMRTLALRMERHCATALELARWLEGHKGVKRVRYPFLPSHPQYELAKRQMSGGSGIVVAEFDGSLEETLAFCRRLRLFKLAQSLGGVESLVSHPASMSHAAMPAKVRHGVGISDGLIRFSVGIEGVEDLRHDLEEALEETWG